MAPPSLHQCARNLWTVEAGPIRFFTFPYMLRMTLIRLESGDLLVHSPIRLDDALRSAIEPIGRPAFVVTPNKLHHLFLGDWARAYPGAKLYAPPKLERKRDDLDFAGVLTDEAPAAWADEVAQRVVRGSWFMDEVVFYHRPSSTVILGDLIENHDPDRFSPLQRWIARRNRMFGETPVNYRLSFRDRASAGKAIEAILAWQPRRVIVAHGACVEDGAEAFLRRGLSWLLSPA